MTSTTKFLTSPGYDNSDESIREVFSHYGEIRQFSRPILKDKCIPSQFAFIKYRDEAAAKDAVESMNNAYIWDVDLTVDEANAQESFFSGSTGIIFSII